MAEHAASIKEQLTVLVVDDEQIVLDSAQKLLRKEPFELVTALSAAEGLTLLEGGGIQVVLTDLKMPGMDGLEFTKRVKQRWPAIPGIFRSVSTTWRCAGPSAPSSRISWECLSPPRPRAAASEEASSA